MSKIYQKYMDIWYFVIDSQYCHTMSPFAACVTTYHSSHHTLPSVTTYYCSHHTLPCVTTCQSSHHTLPCVTTCHTVALLITPCQVSPHLTALITLGTAMLHHRGNPTKHSPEWLPLYINKIPSLWVRRAASALSGSSCRRIFSRAHRMEEYKSGDGQMGTKYA